MQMGRMVASVIEGAHSSDDGCTRKPRRRASPSSAR